MGFRAPGIGAQLSFAGTKYEGLEMTVDAVSLQMLTDLMELYDEVSDGNVKMPALIRLLGIFSSCVESWNVEGRGGEPVPCDVDGLMGLDHKFVIDIIGMWIKSTLQAGDDLGKDSASGSSSDRELLTAAAALSSSLPS
jgi:hypothetical protein